MFFLVVSSFIPVAWQHANGFLWFFLDHPPNSTQVHFMDFQDIGVPAFFYIIGLLMAVSFQNRVKAKGKGPAVLNAIVRWGMVGGVAVLFVVIPDILAGQPSNTWFGQVMTIAPGVSVYVVYWDVVPALAFVGLATIPFLFIPRMPRLVISYAMMTFYQIMTFLNPWTHWRDYAAASVHGGIIGGIFVMIPITLIASVIGEFFILDTQTPDHQKVRELLNLGIVNIVIGLGLWLIPGGYPSKRQSTMSWATISLAVCIFVSLLLIKIDKYARRNWLFKAYGMNPFLIYAMAEISAVMVKALIGDTFLIQLYMLVTIVPAITAVTLILYHYGKAISTTKVAAGVIVVVLVLSAILLPIIM